MKDKKSAGKNNTVQADTGGKAERNKKERLVESLSLSKDAALGVPIVTVIGNYEIYVENFKSIVLYECDTIKLLTKQGMLTIGGTMLEILYYNDEEIAIRGRIARIEY